MSRQQHWECIYEFKADAEISWTEAEPRMSLSFIREACASGRVIDVGGGTSVLAEHLLDDGYSVTVLDISETAVARASGRLGARANRVTWIVADVTAAADLGLFDVWHDRAVFHFLTDVADRATYVALMSRSVPVGAHVVMATFAPDGPERCSGLPVRRYDAQSLGAELGTGFQLLRSARQTHLTPLGRPQSFQYSVFRRICETVRSHAQTDNERFGC